MEITLKRNPLLRSLGVAVLSLGLVSAAVVAPASAADSDTTVVTVKGHVTDRDGKPLKGIRVVAGCPCDFEGGDIPAYISGKDTTSSTGYYAFKVQKQYVKYASFQDPDEKYLPGAAADGKITTTGTTSVLNVKLQLASILAGTVRNTNGQPISGVDLRIYNAKTDKEVSALDASLNEDGQFHARVPAGTYKIKFRGNGYYYGDSWYGGAALKADATAVTVGYGKKLAGLDGTVTVKPSINGRVTVDGENPLSGSGDKIIAELRDSFGNLVQKPRTVLSGNFSFVDLAHGANPVGLQAGDYNLTIRPSTKGAAFFMPVTQALTLAPGTDIRGLVIDVATIPATPADKRGAQVNLRVTSKGTTEIGKAFKSTVVVSSYGDVTGGKVTIYVGGKKITTKTLPASGRVGWSTRFSGIKPGTHSVRIAYSGTDTTAPRKSFVTTVILP